MDTIPSDKQTGLRTKEEIRSYLKKWTPNIPLVNPLDLRVIPLLQSRMTNFLDLKPLLGCWFSFPNKEDCLNNGELLPLTDAFYLKMEGVSEWNKDVIRDIIKKLMQEGVGTIKGKKVAQGLTRLFTGNDHGLPLSDMLNLIGYVESMYRIVRLFKSDTQEENVAFYRSLHW